MFYNEVSAQEKEIVLVEARHAENRGRLTDRQLAVIYKKKWFHLLVPKSLGGAEMNLPEFAKLMESLAMIDGSFAWNVNLGAGANMFAGFMEQNTAAQVFASEKACVAGSGAIRGTAKRKDNGFIINGYWNYASGSAHASYFSLNAQLLDSDKDEYASFIVPTDEVEVLNTWNVFGMKATSSCDFKINNVWVHENYMFNLRKPSITVNSTLYRFPFMLLAEINMLVMVTGLAIHFYELMKKLAEEKVLKDNNKEANAKLIDHSCFVTALNEAILPFLENREIVFSMLDELWQEIDSNGQVSALSSEKFSKSIAEAAKSARHVVDSLYPFAGMRVVFNDTEISRVYRDFKVASQHALLSPTV